MSNANLNFESSNYIEAIKKYDQRSSRILRTKPNARDFNDLEALIEARKLKVK